MGTEPTTLHNSAPLEEVHRTAGALEPAALDEILRCPCRLHHPVVIDRSAETVRCTNHACPLSEPYFPIIGGQPVLVDFTQSILEKRPTIERQTASPVHRRSGWRKKLSRIVFGGKPGARQNVERFLCALEPGGRQKLVLVIGGGTIGAGSERLCSAHGVRTLSLDIYGSEHTQLVADAHSIALQDEQVDGVWIQAVLEHVLSPVEVVAEIYRVLKPRGIVYAETPFMQQVHEGPYDFARFTESGHRWLFRRFDLIASGVERGPFTSLLWSIRYALTGLTRSRELATAFCVLVFWLRYLDLLVPRSYAIDGACDVYFLGRKSDRALSPSEMAGYYAGAQRS
jgi:SAM-dependent methyltransferase